MKKKEKTKTAKGRNPFWKVGAIKYIHKNKKKYNRKRYKDEPDIQILLQVCQDEFDKRR